MLSFNEGARGSLSLSELLAARYHSCSCAVVRSMLAQRATFFTRSVSVQPSVHAPSIALEMPLVLTVALGVLAIVRRGDLTDSTYHVPDSRYPAVFAFPNKGECAATLIDARHALSAAHCFNRGQSTTPFSIQIGGQSFTVVSVALNPCFSFDRDGPNSADLAVLRLDRDVPSNVATPHALYAGGREVGSQFTLIGWGDYGPGGGTEPPECRTTSLGCNQLREGENMFDSIHHNVLRYSLTAQWQGALPREAIAWSGDSGGPAFIGTRLAGINSGGDCCGYGSADEYVRVGSLLSSTWIAQSIARGAAQSIGDCSAWESTGTFNPVPGPSPSPAPSPSPSELPPLVEVTPPSGGDLIPSRVPRSPPPPPPPSASPSPPSALPPPPSSSPLPPSASPATGCPSSSAVLTASTCTLTLAQVDQHCSCQFEWQSGCSEPIGIRPHCE